VSDYQPRERGGWPTQPPVNRPADYGYGYGQQPGLGRARSGRGSRPRRRRRRWPVVLVIVIAVLLAIAAIGDQVARTYAQNRIANQIQTNAKMSGKPSVSIEGWPFLTQIAAHDFKAVDISATNVTANSGKLTFSFTAKATGVHLNSSFNGATVDHINGQAVLPFSSVASLLSLPAGSITLEADPADGPNAIKADAGVIGSLTGTVKLASPTEIAIDLNSASGLASLLGGMSGQSYTVAIPKLPAGLVVKSVSVTSQGIVAAASASNTTLTQ
jgi:hypothetical protein